MELILTRVSNPVTRDWIINLIIGAGLAVVAGLSTYMVFFSR